MTMKSLMQAVALSLAVLGAGPALAHGDVKPQHGGIVQEVREITFELVAEADGAAIYLSDHGKPLAAKGVSGRLTILQGARKTEVDLQDAGGNKLRAAGVKLGKGDRLVAVFPQVAGKAVTVRFTVR